MDIIKKNNAVETYAKKACNVSATCLALGVSRQTFYRWLRTDLKFAQEINDCLEGMIDNVETKLMSKIQDGDTTSIIFFLKTRGKSRGYIENPAIALNITNGAGQYEEEAVLQEDLDASVVSTQARTKLKLLRQSFED